MTAPAAPPTPPLTAARKPSRMTLGNVVAGPVAKPLRLLLYGVDGVGKSTLASCAPSPIFIGAEDGTSALDVKRFPQPETWADLFAALDELEAGEHDYRTVVLDPLGWFEPLCWAKVIAGKLTKSGRPVEAIGDIPYGNGYDAALDEWRLLCVALDRLRLKRNMAVIMLAHAFIRNFKNPDGDDFDRYEIKLHAKAAGLLREWADVVLFATHEQYTHEQNGRTKGITTGARIMYTQRRAAFDAKNRHDLPEVLPLDWQALQEAIAARQPASPETLRDRIAKQLDGAGDAALTDRVRRAVMSAGDDAAALARITNKLAATININKQAAEGT
jgi:hypothetical protein